jgi:palmitoyl-protein thioesterase
MDEQELYKADYIGLRELNDADRLVMEHCPGEHMDLGSGDCGLRMVRDWVGWGKG